MRRNNFISEDELTMMLAKRDRVRGGVTAPGLRVGQVTDGLTLRVGDGGLSIPVTDASLCIKRTLQDGGSQVRNLAPSPKKQFDSKWEETFCAELVLRKHAGLIKAYWYHPTTFHLPGKVKYTPDFLIEYPSGLETRLEYIEIKGWSRNLRDGMTRLKIAAAIFDCYTWKLVKKSKGGGWSETVVEA